jgi:hypothetical protein
MADATRPSSGWRVAGVDESLDPLTAALVMPSIRRPTWEERMSLESPFVRKLEREWAAEGSTSDQR